MAKKSEKNSLVEICPIRNVVARFGNKWALLIIMLLHENGSTRFNRLGKMIPDISTKVLSGTLHTLEADGLLTRTVFPEVPIRVEYELTDTGHSLVPHHQHAHAVGSRTHAGHSGTPQGVRAH